MRLLGAVLAGGRSSRFGSDKALADLHGKPLLQHAVDALALQCDDTIVCGRDWPGLKSVADRPGPDLGPLGGLAAALHHAAANAFDAVVSVGCDTPLLPKDLVNQLAAAGEAAYLRELPIIGLWPARLAPMLDAHLATADDRSLRAWARLANAVAIGVDQPPANINRPEDLVAVQSRP